MIGSSVAPSSPRRRQRSGRASDQSPSGGASTATNDGAGCGAAARTDTDIPGAPAPSASSVPRSTMVSGGRSDNRCRGFRQ